MMRHGQLLLRILLASTVCIATMQTKTTSAQQATKDVAADISDRVPPVQVWDASTSKYVVTLKGHTNGVVSAVFFQNGERVLTGGGDCTARIWDARTGAQLSKIEKTGFNGCYASISQDGSQILTTNHPYVRLWDVKTGDQLLDLTHEVGLERYWPVPFDGSISPDGKQIITCSPVFNLKLRDTKTGAELFTLKGHTYWPNCSAFSSDGGQVVTGGNDEDTAHLWDTKTGKELFALKGTGGGVWSLCFTPDRKRVATGGRNGEVKVWDTRTGDEILKLKGHGSVVIGTSFSPDGSLILAGAQDGIARIWDARTGSELFSLHGHTKHLTAASFSPDGSHVITASWDMTARIWDFKKFQEKKPAP